MKTAEVVDFKFGYAEPDALSLALQCGCYACMAAQKWPSIDAVRVTIIAPRVQKEWTETFVRQPDGQHTTFADIVAKVTEIVVRCENHNAKLVPGTHCYYCKAYALCPAPTGMQGMELDRPIESLPAQKIGMLMDMRVEVKKQIEALEKLARAMLKSGMDIPGWGLKERSGGYQVLNASRALDRVKEYMTQEDFLACADVRWGELRKKIVERVPDLSKKDADQALLSLLGDAAAAKKPSQVLTEMEVE